MRIMFLLLLAGGCEAIVPDSGADSDISGGSDTDLDPDDTDEVSGWRSRLYPKDWAPNFTGPDGRFLHDVSYAGYRYGEPMPEGLPVLIDVVDQGADPSGATDATASIQGAIDEAEAAGGGVVYLPAGDYRIDGELRIDGSGVVLRGAGPDETRLGFRKVEGMSFRSHLTVGRGLKHGADIALVADGAAREATVKVESSADLEVGMDIAVGFVITDAFVAEHGMDGTWQAFNGQWRSFFRRTIVRIDGDTVYLDVPLRYPVKTRDAASIRVASNYTSEVGVEDLSVSTTAPWNAAWEARLTHAIGFQGVKDGWIRNVESYQQEGIDKPGNGEYHLMSGGFKVLDSKRVTIADSDLRYPQNRGGGGNGYLYEISRSSEILTRDSVAVGGRHNFIQNWDFGTSGCVWLRTDSRDGRALSGKPPSISQRGYSEYHHSLAMANLVDDSTTNDGWSAVNRQNYSSGAGHSATQNIFWNVRGDGKLRTYQYGYGYVIGTSPDLEMDATYDGIDFVGARDGTEPQDWLEGLGSAGDLVPRSLYEDQRKKRLAR